MTDTTKRPEKIARTVDLTQSLNKNGAYVFRTNVWINPGFGGPSMGNAIRRLRGIQGAQSILFA